MAASTVFLRNDVIALKKGSSCFVQSMHLECTCAVFSIMSWKVDSDGLQVSLERLASGYIMSELPH